MNAPPNSVKPPSFKAGALLAGKYRVERELGSGGVGVVALATHVELGHRVAIKYLRKSGMTVRGIERFKREAKLAANLRSEHVVKVFDVGTLPDGLPYIVMEYLEGEDLGQVLSRGPLPIEQAVQWTLEACTALEEAHQLGIVHRDLKPANLFLAKRPYGPPVVKILDFGISKITESSSLSRMPAMTQQNESFGTPYYMSPEQLVSSANVDARSDIWAMGVCLYELLTGRLPFEGGDDLRQLVADVLSSTPTPIRDYRSDIPIELAQTIHGCLSYDPGQRPRTVAAFAERIRPFASGQYVRQLAFAETSLEASGVHHLGWSHQPSQPVAMTPTPTPTSAPARSPYLLMVAIAAASLLLGAALAVGFAITRAPKPPPQSLVGAAEVVVALPAASQSPPQLEIIEMEASVASVETKADASVAPPPPPPTPPRASPAITKPKPGRSASTNLDEFGGRR